MTRYDTRSLADQVRSLTDEELDRKIAATEDALAALVDTGMWLRCGTLPTPEAEQRGALKAGLGVLQIEKRIRQRLADREPRSVDAVRQQAAE